MSGVGIEAEAEIVWLEDISNMDYVREGNWSRTRPYCKPPKSDKTQTVVGYSVLKPGIKSALGDVYMRRVFTLRPEDRFYDSSGIYQADSPAEAVDPKTVQPGVRGIKTDKVRGR
jgi:hypothetical protein